MEKVMVRRGLALALALAAWPAFAQNTATVSWVPSAIRVDGTQLAGASTFNVYQGATVGVAVPVLSGVAASPVTIASGIPAGTVCFFVTQVEVATGAESAPSLGACKTFAPAAPMAPTGVIVR